MSLDGGVPLRHPGRAPTKLPSANGLRPTGTVATTVLVEVSITETVPGLPPLFAAYAVVPLFAATVFGRIPPWLSG